MDRTMLLAALLLTPLALSAMLPTAAAHVPCDLFAGQTVTTNPTTLTVPVPGSVGPATVPQQTVGGQTVGGQTVGGQPIPSHTLPTLVTVGGVPVLGTVTVGGQTVGGGNVPTQTLPSHTVPQETVGPVTVGPVPTGLDPIVVTIHGQSATLPVSVPCTASATFEAVRHVSDYEWCIEYNLVWSGRPDPGAALACRVELL